MKDKTIQYMRVVSMLIIVAYHCVCYYGIWDFEVFDSQVKYDCIECFRGICNVALKSFVFISGLLYAKAYLGGRYKNSYMLIKVKLCRLLMPYLTWSIVAVLLFPTENAGMQILSGIQHLWFLLMLLIIFLYVAIGGGICVKYSILVWTGTLILDVLVAKFLQAVPNIFAWKTALHYLPAFFAGIVLVKYRIDIKSLRISKIALCILMAASMVLVATFIIIPYWPFGSLYISLPTYMLLACVYILGQRGKNMLKDHGIVQSLDCNSMGIYIIHHFAIWAVLLYVPYAQAFMNSHQVVAPIILFISVFSFSWATAAVLNKNKFTSLLFDFRPRFV